MIGDANFAVFQVPTYLVLQDVTMTNHVCYVTQRENIDQRKYRMALDRYYQYVISALGVMFRKNWRGPIEKTHCLYRA